MRVELRRFTCHDCEEVFEAEVVLDAPIDVYVASLREISCPKCGSFKVGHGGELKGAPIGSRPVQDRLIWWLNCGDVGVSSMTIHMALTGGGGRSEDFDYPHDPADFRRCYRLLEIIPEWRSRLGEVTARFPWWKPFEQAWERMEEFYREELPTGEAPKLYAEMRKAGAEANEIRWGRR